MKLKFKLPKPSEFKLPLDLSSFDRFDRQQYKLAAMGMALVIVLMAAAGLAAFLLSLRGTEQTLVPDLRGAELSQALIRLQEKELYPRIALRFTDQPADRGRIVEQKPLPGAIVKAGRRIQLVVSRGPVVDRVENYLGQDLNAVKLHLQTLFASSTPLLSVKEPPIYVFDTAVAGTVLEQKPLPDTELSGPTALELVVSRGPEKVQLAVPKLEGLGFEASLREIEKSGLPALFTVKKPAGKEKPGLILSQNPPAGTTLDPKARVNLVLASPSVEKGMVFGLFSRELPVYPYPLRLSLEVLKPSGERVSLLSMEHPGGSFSAPYLLPEGSVLTLRVLDREIARMELGSP